MSRSNAPGHDHAPFDDDYRGFDVREDETARGPLILALAIGVLLIFGAVVWNTYRQGIRPDGEGLPSIIAGAEPLKSAPEDAGGITVAHTELQFYDGMDATTREPVTATAGAELAGEGTVPDLVRGPVEPVTELGDAAVPAPVIEAAATLPAVSAERAPAPEPKGPQALFAFSKDGAYLVQIAALQSEEAAQTAWKRVTASAPELYYGASNDIQRADRGAEGVVYRLRVGAFADRSGAKAFCDELSKTGAQCFVVKK